MFIFCAEFAILEKYKIINIWENENSLKELFIRENTKTNWYGKNKN